MPKKSKKEEPLEEEPTKEEISLEEPMTEEEFKKYNTPSAYKVSKKGTEKMATMIDTSDWGLGDAPEPIVVPDGTEWELRVLSVRNGEDKNKKPYFLLSFEIPAESLAKDFTHFLYRPDRESMNEKEFSRSVYNLQCFLQAFEIDMSSGGIDPNDWPGERGWAILGVKEDETYGKQNVIKKWVLPK